MLNCYFVTKFCLINLLTSCQIDSRQALLAIGEVTKEIIKGNPDCFPTKTNGFWAVSGNIIRNWIIKITEEI